MSILTDTDLRDLICSNEAQLDSSKILISDFQEPNLTPLGYDLRVGGYYKTYGSGRGLVQIKPRQKITIKPGDTALIATLEAVKMPQDGSVSALIVSKVSQVAKGLSNISTKVDPNWAGGQLLIAVHNFSREPINLAYSESICTIIFFDNKSPTKKAPRSGGIDRFNISSPPELKIERIISKYSPIIVVLAIPAIVYYFFGKSVIFDASIPISVAISELLSKLMD